METMSTAIQCNFGCLCVVVSEVLSNLGPSALADFTSFFCLPFAFEKPVDEFNDESDALKWLIEANGL